MYIQNMTKVKVYLGWGSQTNKPTGQKLDVTLETYLVLPLDEKIFDDITTKHRNL
jgi:hypothetical protein